MVLDEALLYAGLNCDKSKLTHLRDPERDFHYLPNENASRLSKQTIGGKPYILPIGSYTYGFTTAGTPKDNSWLSDDDSGWVVAYHGTTPKNMQGILMNGFDKSKIWRDIFAKKFKSNTYGFYCAPDPATAAFFTPRFFFKGKTYYLILQVRVHPSKIQFICHGETKRLPNFFQGNGDCYRIESSEHIRPCGICIFPCETLDNEDYITDKVFNENIRFAAVTESIMLIFLLFILLLSNYGIFYLVNYLEKEYAKN